MTGPVRGLKVPRGLIRINFFGKSTLANLDPSDGQCYVGRFDLELNIGLGYVCSNINLQDYFSRILLPREGRISNFRCHVKNQHNTDEITCFSARMVRKT